MKAKLSSILLLILLIAPALITYSFFQFKRIIVRNEVRKMIFEGVDKENLVLLEFTKRETLTELRWEHNGEFEYRQQMYDIVETIEAGNTVYYWCWWDKDETELKRQLGELGKKAFDTDPLKKERHDRLNTFYKSLFCLDRQNFYLPIEQQFTKQRLRYNSQITSFVLPPPTPPPQIS